MEYTMAQINLYYREAIHHDNASQAAGIIAANLGFTGGKAAKDAIERLTR
ncbi:MAG: hypothetical protein FWH15_06705 [Betaproteobacteria bacterium]|nr:hypothetical protein [Betaproteobacteria bacterium]